MVKCLNPWDPQSKRQYRIDGCYATLNAGHALGGQAHGICYAIEGNTVDRASSKNGKGYCKDVSPTLNTQDRHAVCICLEGNGARESHKGPGFQISDKMYTLNTVEQHAVCYSVDGRNNRIVPDVSGTLQAHTGGGWSINCTHPVLYENDESSVD